MRCRAIMGLWLMLGAGGFPSAVTPASALAASAVAAPRAVASRPPAVAPVGASVRPVASAQPQLLLDSMPVQGGLVRGTAPSNTARLDLDGTPVDFDVSGGFLVGFDRDSGPSANLTATLADGRTVTRTLAIAPRAWRLERVDAALRPTVSSAAFLALRKPELAQIAAARALRTDASGWRQSFLWPIRGRISGLFGAQRIYRGQPGAYHGGIDIAAATGDIVRAPADGVVILAAAKPFTLEGNLLMIDHGGGLNSAFLHLSRIDVAPGVHVVQGQPIGAAGATGRATGPHLHWGLMWKGARIDPLLVVDAKDTPKTAKP